MNSPPMLAEADWIVRFGAAVAILDASMSPTEAESVGRLVYGDAHFISPEELAWLYVGRPERRSAPRA